MTFLCVIGKVWATAWNTLNTCDSLRRSWEDQDQIQDARETIITLRVHKCGVYSTEISIQQMFIISKGNTNVKKNFTTSILRTLHNSWRKKEYNKYTFNSVGRFLMCFVLYFFVLFGFLSFSSFYVYMTYCTYVHHLESEGCALYSIHILARQINLTIQYFYNIYKKILWIAFSSSFCSISVFFHIPFLYCRGWLGGRYWQQTRKKTWFSAQ